jgi:hypothetical protein
LSKVNSEQHLSETDSGSVQPELPFRWLDGYSNQLSPPQDTKMTHPLLGLNFHLRKPVLRFAADQAMIVLSMQSLHVQSTKRNLLRRTAIDFVGLQVQTSGTGQEPNTFRRSLIHPWNFRLRQEICDVTNHSSCGSHSIEVNAEKLHVHAAYSDIGVVLAILPHLLEDTRRSEGVTVVDAESGSRADLHLQPPVASSNTVVLDVNCTGIELAVVDDSFSQFVSEQRLLLFFIESILIRRVVPSTSNGEGSDHAVRMHIHQLEVVDCLQSETSPYRKILLIIPNTPSIDDGELRHPLCFDEADKSCQSVGNILEMPMNITRKPSIDLFLMGSDVRTSSLTIDSIEIQYNPSLVIALHCLLGRLSKDYNRHEHCFKAGNVNEKKEAILLSLVCVMKHLNIRFNKERLQRTLMELIISDILLTTKRGDDKSSFNGSIGNLFASDPSFPSNSLCNTVFKRNSRCSNFVSFCYETSRKGVVDTNTCFEKTPQWMHPIIESDTLIHDFLDATVCSVEIVYLRERTEEFLHYVKNEMSRMKIRASSVADKGLPVLDRTRKSSFIQVRIDSPTLTVPSKGFYPVASLKVNLGEYDIRSWAIEPFSERSCRRIVSVELFGFSGAVSKTMANQMENPIVANVDASVMVDLSSSVEFSVKVSDIRVRVAYTDYEAILCVYNENLARKANQYTGSSGGLLVGEEDNIVDHSIDDFVSSSTTAR